MEPNYRSFVFQVNWFSNYPWRRGSVAWDWRGSTVWWPGSVITELTNSSLWKRWKSEERDDLTVMTLKARLLNLRVGIMHPSIEMSSGHNNHIVETPFLQLHIHLQWGAGGGQGERNSRSRVGSLSEWPREWEAKREWRGGEHQMYGKHNGMLGVGASPQPKSAWFPGGPN